jgi:hypothetical protein
MTITFSRRVALRTLSAAGFAAFSRQPRALTNAAPTSAPEPLDQLVQLPSIDSTGIAKRVVGTLKPNAGETAILVHDPTYYPDLTLAIYRELNSAGVHPIVMLTFEPAPAGSGVSDPVEAARVLAADPKRSTKREAEAVVMLLPMFEKADIFLWLPARYTWPDLRWERLVGATRTRGIHFHWIPAPERLNPDELRDLSRIYERAVLDTDYARISQKQDELIGAMRGKQLRIQTSEGTDLEMLVPKIAIFHKNDGDMSASRARQAKSVRDREMEVPVGALRFIPDVSSVSGRLVIREVSTRQGVAERVTIDFKDGRALKVAALKNETGFHAEWEGVGGDVDKLGEIVIGTNPLLVGRLPSGELPYFGYGAGYVRISLGENWESGGSNRSPLRRPLWFLLENATLSAGGAELIRQGKLTI